MKIAIGIIIGITIGYLIQPAIDWVRSLGNYDRGMPGIRDDGEWE